MLNTLYTFSFFIQVAFFKWVFSTEMCSLPRPWWRIWAMLYQNRSWHLCRCHAKRRLRWHQPSHAFGMTLTIKSNLWSEFNRTVSAMPKVGVTGLVQVKRPFGMTLKKILRPVLAWRGLWIYSYVYWFTRDPISSSHFLTYRGWYILLLRRGIDWNKIRYSFIRRMSIWHPANVLNPYLTMTQMTFDLWAWSSFLSIDFLWILVQS